MKTRIVVALSAASVVAACALIQSNAPPGVSSAVDTASSAGATAKDFNAKLDKCKELEKMKVAIEEECAIGGAVALNWVKQGGGLMLEMPKDVPADLKDRDPKAQRGWWEEKHLGKGPHNDLTRYVNTVGKNLAAQSTRPTLDWSFGVLESDGFNAFSAPGGYVLVTRGLLNSIDNEAQLAGVLAHEIGHVTKQHAIAQYRKIKARTCNATLVQAGAAGLADATGATASFNNLVSGASGGFLNLNDVNNVAALGDLTDKIVKYIAESGFGNEDEYEADEVSVGLVIGAGYNPYEYQSFIAHLPTPATHHPPNADRAKRIQAAIDAFKPAPDAFGSSDYPFTSYPKVALKDELKAAKKK